MIFVLDGFFVGESECAGMLFINADSPDQCEEMAVTYLRARGFRGFRIIQESQMETVSSIFAKSLNPACTSQVESLQEDVAQVVNQAGRI